MALQMYPFGKHAFDALIKEADAKFLWQRKIGVDITVLDKYIDGLVD